MLFIKPYGVTETAFTQEQKEPTLTRNFKGESKDGDNNKQQSPKKMDIKSHIRRDKIRLRLWISAIDKIIQRPNNNEKPSLEAYKKREKLGAECWSLIDQEYDYFEGDLTDVKRIWDHKIHPYGLVTPENCSPPYDYKGKLYHKLVGKTFKERQVALKIRAHINTHQDHIIKSIQSNTAQSSIGKLLNKDDPCFTKKELVKYFSEGKYGTKNNCDLAETLRDILTERASAFKSTKSSSKNQSKDEQASPPTDLCQKTEFQTVVATLYKHTDSLVNPEGKGLPDPSSLEDGDERKAFIYIHKSITELYRKILKRKKGKKARYPKERGESLWKHRLPKKNKNIQTAILSQSQNKTTNALIRLGKVIHYDLLEKEFPKTKKARIKTDDIIKSDFSTSQYWDSTHQTEIKQTEALVRLWREVASLSNRTMQSWVNPLYDGEENSDYTTDPNFKKDLNGFSTEYYQQKLPYLFGENYHDFLFSGDITKQKEFCQFAIDIHSNFRHNIFHFKRRITTQKIFDGVRDENYCPSFHEKLSDLIRSSYNNLSASLGKTLEALDLKDFATQTELNLFYDTQLSGKNILAQTPIVPLPQFKKLLKRAESTCEGKLPPHPSQQEKEENRWINGQYHLLKLCYEHGFRNHLNELEEAQNDYLSPYLEKAIAKADHASKTLYQEDQSRIHKLIGPQTFVSLIDLQKKLSHALNSNMRVQNSYGSDSQEAKQQSKFIENLKIDILALLFQDYITKNLCTAWLTDTIEVRRDKAAGQSLEATFTAQPPEHDITALSTKTSGYFFFVLHFSPISSVNRLYQQLIRHKIAASDGVNMDQAEDNLLPLIRLYLLHHDAQFQGDCGVSMQQELSPFFEDPSDFDRIFTQKTGQEKGGYTQILPIRGLREYFRHGDHRSLHHIYKNFKIRQKSVSEWEEKRKDISATQKKRALQHAKFVKLHEQKQNNLLSQKDYDAKIKMIIPEYQDQLKIISNYRNLTSEVTLQDFVRLHQLTTSLYARAIDYAGILERDLYFIMLAKIHLNPTAFKEFFTCFNSNKKKKFEEDLAEAGKKIFYLFKKMAGEEEDNLKRRDLFLEFFEPEKIWKINSQQNFAEFLTDITTKRDHITHFTNYSPTTPSNINVTDICNDLRELFGYDRKMKNAIARSFIDLLDREGFKLEWQMTQNHKLSAAQLKSKDIFHLNKIYLKEEITNTGSNKKTKQIYVTEKFHSERFVKMISSLFKSPSISLTKSGKTDKKITAK